MSAARDIALTPPPGRTGPSEYVMLSPEGKMVTVSKELFEAVCDLAKMRAGSLLAQFRNGGIAGVEVTRKYK